MKSDTHGPAEPRSQLIIRHTHMAIRQSGLTVNVFATAVAEEYESRVALHERGMEFHRGTTADQVAKAEKANAQLISRIINGNVKFPDDLEESWVAALPSTHRDNLVRELSARYGLLAVRMPAAPSDVAGQMNVFAQLSIEFGQTIQSLAPIFADGACSTNDRIHVDRALRELDDLMASAMTMRQQLLQVREGAGNGSQLPTAQA